MTSKPIQKLGYLFKIFPVGHAPNPPWQADDSLLCLGYSGILAKPLGPRCSFVKHELLSIETALISCVQIAELCGIDEEVCWDFISSHMAPLTVVPHPHSDQQLSPIDCDTVITTLISEIAQHAQDVPGSYTVCPVGTVHT